jgi:rubrerythrin
MEETKTLTTLEIAKIACDIEADGKDFYNTAAREASDEKAKQIFNKLAQQEFEHLRFFRNMYKEFDETIGGFESSVEYLFDDEITKYLNIIYKGMIFPTGAEAENWLSSQPDIKSILRFAIDVEKNSILFYSEILSHSAFTNSKEILKKIIREEKTHVVILSRLLKGIK